jgi:peptidyl-tRNA hydrolase
MTEIPADLKMYAIVYQPALKKMGGNRGKLGAQQGHAYLHAFWDAEEHHPARAKAYKHSGAAKKITLVCEDEDLMRALAQDYRAVCGTTVVEDAGLTVFKGEKTFTMVGIGPLAPQERDERLASLPPLI